MASSVRQQDEIISEDAYFELEKQTDTRHEFIDGYVYAMVSLPVRALTVAASWPETASRRA